MPARKAVLLCRSAWDFGSAFQGGPCSLLPAHRLNARSYAANLRLPLRHAGQEGPAVLPGHMCVHAPLGSVSHDASRNARQELANEMLEHMSSTISLQSWLPLCTGSLWSET